MKILHTSVMSEPAIGVVRQLETEKSAADDLNIHWQAKFYSDHDMDSGVAVKSPVSASSRIKFRISYYKWLVKEAKNQDVVLLRYSLTDPFQLLFLLWCRRPVFTVHHTLEVPELKLSNRKFRKLKSLLESLIGGISLSLVDGIVAVTPEILEYEVQRRLFGKKIPTFVYPNGIEYGSCLSNVSNTSLPLNGSTDVFAAGVRESHMPRLGPPILLIVSSTYAAWQGLEELVEAAKNYKPEFVCNVVGHLTSAQAKMLEQDPRFLMHGTLGPKDISDLIVKSDVGLGGLALHKKNMEYGCTLKVREYLVEGLSVYSGHRDVFPNSFKHYRIGGIDMESIVDFAVSSRLNDRVLVSELARPYIEKRQILDKLYRDISSVITGVNKV